MKILKELFIVSLLVLGAEALIRITGAPIPGPVLGMVVLLILLLTRAVKPQQIETTGGFFLKNLTFLFLPLVVSTRSNLGVLKDYGWQIAVLMLVTTMAVMAVTGITAQILLKLATEETDDE